MTKMLYDRAAALLEKIGGATEPKAMELNAWEALRLAREMRAAHEPSAKPDRAGVADGELLDNAGRRFVWVSSRNEWFDIGPTEKSAAPHDPNLTDGHTWDVRDCPKCNK